MGVPRLFPYIRLHFPTSVKNFAKGDRQYHCDILLIDGNGVLHRITQEVFNYGENKRPMDPYEKDENGNVMTFKDKLLLVFKMFFEFMVIDLYDIVNPSSIIYITIDGSAPIAKQAEQRKRRLIASLSRSANPFNSNSISPGTTFEFELTKYINYAIRDLMNKNSKYQTLKIYFSPPTVPGEGEHKLMDFIRTLPQNVRDNSKFCFFGPDGDLILLTLATHVNNIQLLREDVMNPTFFDMCDIGTIRKDLIYALGQQDGFKKGMRTYNDVSNDTVAVAAFVGNDFVPKVQMFMFLEKGLEYMFDTYRYVTQGGFLNYITYMKNDGTSHINHKSFTKFVNEIAKQEYSYLNEQLFIPPLSEKLRNVTLDDCATKTIFNKVTQREEKHLDYDEYRKRYYMKSGIDVSKPHQVDNMCFDYLRTLAWAFTYYTNGLEDFRHYYKWHYAPFISDLGNMMAKMEPSLSESIYKFPKTSPTLPFIQLLCILPPSSADLLPGDDLRSLMTSTDSPLVKSGMYNAEGTKTDYEGKLKEHMGVVLLPFVDVNLVEKAALPTIQKFGKDTYVRNSVGKPIMYTYDSEKYTSDYTSDYGNIEDSHVIKTMLCQFAKQQDHLFVNNKKI